MLTTQCTIMLNQYKYKFIYKGFNIIAPPEYSWRSGNVMFIKLLHLSESATSVVIWSPPCDFQSETKLSNDAIGD